MKEERLSKKLHPSGSLARRMLLVCLGLLVLPLCLHSMFLYRIEYREKLADIQLNLKVIGIAQTALIRERASLLFRRLDAISDMDDPVVKKLGISSMRLPVNAKGHFIWAEPSKGVLFGKEIEEHQALGIWVPFSELLNQLGQVNGFPYPVFIALLGENRTVLAGAIKEDALQVEFPIQRANFSLALTVPEKSIEAIQYQTYLYRFVTLVVFIGAIGGTIVILLSRRITKPLQRLCHTLDRVSEGAIHVRYEPDRMGFEINELGKQFNMTLDALFDHQKSAHHERIQREKLAQEFRIGKEIQMNLLPQHLPEWEALDIAPGFKSAKEVSGDFYDLFPFEEDKLLIVIADTAGKGISACLYALGLRSLLRGFVTVKGNLSEALLDANHLFWLDARQSGMFITAWVGIYDRKSHELTYANLGHPPAILKRKNHLLELATQGIALGAIDADLIETKTMVLHPEDLLFLYTDGILEAESPSGGRFGLKNLQETLQSNACPSDVLIENLWEEIEKFTTTAPQHDDMACLSIRIRE